jgi:hypothetical protein
LEKTCFLPSFSLSFSSTNSSSKFTTVDDVYSEIMPVLGFMVIIDQGAFGYFAPHATSL